MKNHDLTFDVRPVPQEPGTLQIKTIVGDTEPVPDVGGSERAAVSRTKLGTGRLSWCSSERRCDRYGAVYLMADGDSLTTPSGYVRPTKPPVGRRGRLVAEVVETRRSTHGGDVFHGIFPETPKVGERIVLGEGELFVEPTSYGATAVGLRPDDGRLRWWLDPRALYRAHEQTVRLYFEEV